jgi:hypothetical protein
MSVTFSIRTIKAVCCYVNFLICCVKSHYDKCHYAECNYADMRDAECRYAERLYAEYCYPESTNFKLKRTSSCIIKINI